MIFRFLLSLFLVSSVFGQAPGNQSLTLSTLNFKGLEKISSDQAVGASKLTLKSKINLTHLDDAAKSLVESGLFKNASYCPVPRFAES
jgi:outer membrane protein assembly factor BamA